LLRGPHQRVTMERLELEYENLRAALRRAIAARDEQEALCLVNSLGWYWQLREHKADARTFSAAASALGPDPFAAPVEPAPPLHDRCTDAPPPMPPDQLQEARRGSWLIQMANYDDYEAWTSGAAQELMRGVVKAYRPGLPQVCRVPGFLWYYALLLTGSREQLDAAVDAAVRTCRELGYDWELAFLLQQRANILASHPGAGAEAGRDAEESLELFLRAGDAWGAGEALSSSGEARENRGEYEAAARDFREAKRYAEQLGARAQVTLLTARLAAVLMESGEWERAELMFREVIDEGRRAFTDAVPFARMHLTMLLGRTGRTDEARQQLEAVGEEFRSRVPGLFQGMLLSLLAWIDGLDGRYADALPKIRQALTFADDTLTAVVMPQLPIGQLNTAARILAALGGAERAWTAARLLGAYDTLLPPAHFKPSIERETREGAERDARAALGDTAYSTAYEEGGGLSLEEATALI
jgi:tetratricopeptide (TPR) repeat protein